MPITEDAPQFGEMEREWQEALRRHIAASSAERTEAVSKWEASVAAMRREQLDLQRAGSWLAGPIDLMGVIGQERQELAHSAAIAWLLDPRMPHGLGSRLLSALASSCYPDEAFAELGQAWTEREVARENARIDILVHAPNLTLVLENKVDALESEG